MDDENDMSPVDGGDAASDTSPGPANGRPQRQASESDGLQPIVDQAIHSLLEEQVTTVARKALTQGRLAAVDTERVEQLAKRALERQLAELADPPGLYYQSLGEFAGWLLQVYRRSTRGQARVFCPQWWKHPEAVARMDALWRAFEQLRQDPGTGMSVWFRDHADHHMSVLLDADGPFKGCEDGHSDHPLEPIHHDEPAAALFERDLRGMPDAADDGPAVASSRPQPSGARTTRTAASDRR
jgi:hypothetical protein